MDVLLLLLSSRFRELESKTCSRDSCEFIVLTSMILYHRKFLFE